MNIHHSNQIHKRNMPKVGKKRARVHGTGPVPTGARGGKGQHFLRNMTVVQRIVDKAAIKRAFSFVRFIIVKVPKPITWG